MFSLPQLMALLTPSASTSSTCCSITSPRQQQPPGSPPSSWALPSAQVMCTARSPAAHLVTVVTLPRVALAVLSSSRFLLLLLIHFYFILGISSSIVRNLVATSAFLIWHLIEVIKLIISCESFQISSATKLWRQFGSIICNKSQYETCCGCNIKDVI